VAARNRENKGDDMPALAWAVAALGAILVAGALGFMLYKAFAGDDSPPQFEIDVESIAASGDDYLVQIRVANVGGLAAAAVVIEGILTTADGDETSTITLDYVPSKSHRHAGLYFSQDPQQRDLKIRALGYVQP
jgi:uncharacterized protein (TIGR02588 family)